MFGLLNDLFIRSNGDDDDDDDEAEVNEEDGDGEVESDAAATIIAQAKGVVVVEEGDEDELKTNDTSDDDGDQSDASRNERNGQYHAVLGRVDDEDNSCCEEINDDDDDDNDDEWNGLFQEFKTGMLSLTSSVSTVSAVAAKVLTGAIEEASLITSAGAGRPPFVLSAADEDGDECSEDEEDEMEEKKIGASEDGHYDNGEGIEDDEDEEVNFLEAPIISNEENDPRRHKTILKLESLDIVKMRQRLMSAEEKRNKLMQMVDARNEEICKLRFEMNQCIQRRPRRQSDLESNVDFNGTSCSSVDRIQWLKRETEWWKHLILSNTNDSKLSAASMKALSATISQLRDDLHHSNANDCSVQESIKASDNMIPKK